MIYIVHGSDGFRRQLQLEQFKKQYLEPGMEALNFSQLKNPDLMDFISSVGTVGFGFGTKLIVIKEFSFLESKADDKEVESIIQSLEQVPENTVLVFENEKISGTIKLVKNLKGKTDSVQFLEVNKFNSWDTKPAATWLVEFSRQDSSRQALDYLTAEYLVEQVGSEDSGKLHSELNRLYTISSTINQDLINKECNARHDIFKFIRHLAEGKVTEANKELRKIIAVKEANLGLLALSETSISRYLKLKLAEQEGRSQNQMAELLGISPGRLYYQKQEASKMKVPHLEKLLDKVLDYERSVKTGKYNIEQALKLLVNA